MAWDRVVKALFLVEVTKHVSFNDPELAKQEALALMRDEDGLTNPIAVLVERPNKTGLVTCPAEDCGHVFVPDERTVAEIRTIWH